jgi:hypothetical protein
VIEQRIADRFRTAVLAEPPLGFDPDDLVDRAKRQQRHRRAIVASAAATVGIALAAVGVFAASGGGARLDAGSPPGSVPPATESPTPPSAKENVDPTTAPPSFPGSEAAVAHLGQMIPMVLAEKVPGLKFTKPDSGELMVDSTRRAVGGAYQATGTKHRYVSVFISHHTDTLNLAGDPAAGGGWGPLTSDTTRTDGSQLRIYTFGDGGSAAGLLVVHLRTDGVIVMADTTAKPEPGRSGLAVSQQVLTAIATDARLTF